MKPITWQKPNGDWGIDGVDLSTLPPQVYGALYKLLKLEHPTGATNAEHIRALDDKELAAFLIAFLESTPDYCRRLPACDEDLDNDREIPAQRCMDCLLYWLQDPHTHTHTHRRVARPPAP